MAKAQIDRINDALKEVQAVEVPQSLLARIPKKVRSAMYLAGAVLGVVGTVAPIVAAMLTGEAATMAISLGALALTINSLIARANIRPV